MQYLLLIYSNEAEIRRPPAGRIGEDHGRIRRVHPGHHPERQLQGRRAAAAGAMATTVRVRDGKTLTTDGPFAETREQLGGYYLIDAKNLDEATAIAAKIPGARYGSVEVRPIWAMGEP